MWAQIVTQPVDQQRSRLCTARALAEVQPKLSIGQLEAIGSRRGGGSFSYPPFLIQCRQAQSWRRKRLWYPLLQSLGTTGIHPTSVTSDKVIDDRTRCIQRDDDLDMTIEMHAGGQPARPTAAANLDRQLGHDAAHDSRMS